MEPLLRAERVTVCYRKKPVLSDVSFQLKEGEILGVVGESGSGKSTLLRAILGLPGPEGAVTGGAVFYKGQDLTHMTGRRMRSLRGQEIGMIFQDCQAALCPTRRIKDQIWESMSEHVPVSREEAWRRAAEIMTKIGLTDTKRVLDSYPFELSGGMNQRVGICIAMLLHPPLLLADEPTSALDVTVQKQVTGELLQLRREYRTAMVLVTHNIGVAAAMADQLLVLKDGKAVEYGPAERILRRPSETYTRELMDSVLRLRRGA